jgi:tetratricopeptide (TPR) repeat protein
MVAHVLSQGTMLPDELLRLVEADLAQALEEFPDTGYRKPHSIFGRILSALLSSAGSDGRLAVELVRLLTSFAPESLPLTLITSQMSGTEHEPGGRLPGDLAAALRTVQRRKAILEHIVQTGLAQLSTDHITGAGQVLTLHRLTWNSVRDQLPARIAGRNRHIAHRVLCDADPFGPDRPEWWPRYLQLWRQLPASDALGCERVAEPGDPCAQIPTLVGNVIRALRDKGELTAAADLGARAAAAWGPILGDRHVGLALVLIETSSALWQLNRSAEALENAMAARQLVESDRSHYPVEFVRASSLVAAGMRQAGQWMEAVRYDEEAYRWAVEFIGQNDVATIRAGHNLSVSFRMMGRFRDALDLDSDTYARCQDNPALGENSTLTLHSVNNIARDRRELGEYETAVRMQEHTVARFEALLHDPRQQHLLRARKNLAVSYQKAGRYQQAFDTEVAAFDDHWEVYGSQHLETIAAETNLANDCRLTGNLDEALRHAAAAYDRWRANRPTHPFTAACAVNYAAALRARGQFDEALRLDREAVATFESRLGADHPYTLAAQVDVASDLAGQGRTAEAASLGQDTLGRLGRVRGQDHPYTLQCAVNLTADLRTLGRQAEADPLERDSLERYIRTLGREHPQYQAAAARTRGTCDVEPPPM